MIFIKDIFPRGYCGGILGHVQIVPISNLLKYQISNCKFYVSRYNLIFIHLAIISFLDRTGIRWSSCNSAAQLWRKVLLTIAAPSDNCIFDHFKLLVMHVFVRYACVCCLSGIQGARSFFKCPIVMCKSWRHQAIAWWNDSEQVFIGWGMHWFTRVI